VTVRLGRQRRRLRRLGPGQAFPRSRKRRRLLPLLSQDGFHIEGGGGEHRLLRIVNGHYGQARGPLWRRRRSRMLVHRRWSNDRPLPAHVDGKRSAARRGGRIEVVAAEEWSCAALAAQGGLAARLRRGYVAEIIAALLPADIPVGWGMTCRIDKRWAAIVDRRWLYRMTTDLK
jgi:hypothetical protein